MYNCEELFNLVQKPRINDISLNLLCEYYKKHLLPFKFKYVLDGAGKDVVLEFKKENFCHLLGIDSIAKKSVSKNKLSDYRGVSGFSNIEDNSITFTHLKIMNKKKFKDVKAKFVYFYLLPKLVTKPFAVKFENSNVFPPTSIECEILFYSKVANDNAIIHLGIEKKENGYYFPRTFFVEKVSEEKYDIYISNQETLLIKNTEVFS